MFARAIAEFQFTLVFADAPIDRFLHAATTVPRPFLRRRGPSCFGKARCVSCHAVSGQSNEMFSDFKMQAGVPQIAPFFGMELKATDFDGPDEDEDFG